MKMSPFFTAVALATLSFGTMAASPAFSLGSTDIPENRVLTQKQIFNGFGCAGGNISPQLHWQYPPEGTKSYAITLFDPDAPTGSGWWHWTVVNIPASIQALPSGVKVETLSTGMVQGRNDFGYAGFGGACPPVGDKPHRYQFTLWALNTEALPVDHNTSGALVGFMLNSHVIAKAELTATYGR